MELGYAMPGGGEMAVDYFAALARAGRTGRSGRDACGGPKPGGEVRREAGGVNILWALVFLFAGLKVAGAVSWSWWAVFSPVLIPLAVPLLWLSLLLVFAPVVALIRCFRPRRNTPACP